MLNERFTAITAQLGDGNAAVRLAGVHAMAGLAEDWEENRQTCIDVLCAYLRLPYEPDPGNAAPAAERLAFRANREVRHTVIRVIAAHLRDGAKVSWRELEFDFTGAIFDGGSFSFARFPGKTFVSFAGAEFSGGTVDFDLAEFSGGVVDFTGARFTGGAVRFIGARFSGGAVGFARAEFSGSLVEFGGAEFSGSLVEFGGAEFSGSTVSFRGAEFTGAAVSFMGAGFSGGVVDFIGARFTCGAVDFRNAEFTGGAVSFPAAKFSGSTVEFGGAEFSGGVVDFSAVWGWSHPPKFDFDLESPPQGVRLPAAVPAGSSVTTVTGSDTQGSSALEHPPLAGSAGRSADGSGESEH